LDFSQTSLRQCVIKRGRRAAEVRQTAPEVVAYEDVPGTQVSVSDVSVVDVGKSAGDVLQNSQNLALRQFLSVAELIKTPLGTELFHD
jgi:hypothetical protein